MVGDTLMPTLRSGLVIAGAYADKLRRTAFAQLKGAMKEGTLSASDIAYHVAQLNKVLYRILVDELKINKGDVVRIIIDYEIKDKSIEWKFETLKIEAFRRIPDEEVDSIVKRVIESAVSIMEAAVEYTVEKIGETADGDLIYLMKLGDREVGAFEVIQINEEFAYIKKGAALEPNPMIIEKVRVPLEGKGIDEALRDNINVFTKSARYVSRDEAEKLINYIKGRAGVKPEEVSEEVEE